MEVAIAVGLAILAVIFLVALMTMFYICRRRYTGHAQFPLTHVHETSESSEAAMSSVGDNVWWNKDDEDISLAPADPRIAQFEEMQENSLDDPCGLIPHCLEVLKTCHELTERLVAVTMKNAIEVKSKEKLREIITVAKRISPRVDDLVRCMYPPLDAKLIEARATALLLSVNHLVLVAKSACHTPGTLDWVDECLTVADDHVETLRAAAMAEELEPSPQSTPESECAMLGTRRANNYSDTEHL